MNERRAAWRKWLVRIYVVVALGFFAYALVEAWDETGGVLPPTWRLVAAGAIYCVGVFAGAFAWMILLDDRRTEIGAGYIVSQLAKYTPGAIWQPASQVGLARSAGDVSLRRGVVAFTVNVVSVIAVGGMCCVFLAAAWTDQTLWIRVLIGAGALVSVVLLDRRWMVFVLAWIPRTRQMSSDMVPRQSAILLACCCHLVSLVSAAASFLILLGSFGRVDPVLVLAGFIGAWTVGFVLVPIPSGLVAREAVLATILASTFPASVIVAASVYQRLVAIAAEGLLAAIVAPGLRRRRRERGESDILRSAQSEVLAHAPTDPDSSLLDPVQEER